MTSMGESASTAVFLIAGTACMTGRIIRMDEHVIKGFWIPLVLIMVLLPVNPGRMIRLMRDVSCSKSTEFPGGFIPSTVIELRIARYSKTPVEEIFSLRD